MNELQLLRDAETEPTEEMIAEGLGAANTAYVRFVQQLKGHGIQVGWSYYNDGKAWLGKGLYAWTTTRGTQKEITAFWLSIWKGFFKVSIFLPERTRADVLALPLGKEVREMVQASGQMGKMKTFPVIFNLRSDELFNDLFMLVNFKKKLK